MKKGKKREGNDTANMIFKNGNIIGCTGGMGGIKKKEKNETKGYYRSADKYNGSQKQKEDETEATGYMVNR